MAISMRKGSCSRVQIRHTFLESLLFQLGRGVAAYSIYKSRVLAPRVSVCVQLDGPFQDALLRILYGPI